VRARPLLDIHVFAAFAHPCASEYSADDCMDAGGRATPGAVAGLTQLPFKIIYREWHIVSRKKSIFGGVLYLIGIIVEQITFLHFSVMFLV